MLVPGDVITLDLFADVMLTATVDRVIENVNGTVTVRGRIENHPLGYLIISTSNNHSLGSIDIPDTGERYRIQKDTLTGVHYLLEENIDLLDELEDGPSPIPPPTSQIDSEKEMPADDIASGPLDPVTIEAMIVYTANARTWAGGLSGINSVIAQAVAKGQLALDNSNTIMTVSLVYSGEISYTEDGDTYTDLARLQNTSDGYMDEVHTLRDQYNADVVGLFTEVEDTGGLGWLLNTTSGSPTYAFSITRVQQASWTYTYIHEMGHNMGCHHRKDQDTQPGPGLYSYSAGWHWTGNDSEKYASVMSYSDGGYGRVAYFSNPSITYQGVATGHSADGDNARNLREIKNVIADYRHPTQTGSLTVTISPQGAIDAGVQWNVDGGGWKNSGATISDLPIGSHIVNPKTVLGWISPASESVTINSEATTAISLVFQYQGYLGEGTQASPYLITNPHELALLANTPQDWNAWCLVTQNIDMKDYVASEMNTIGTYIIPFSGNFNGDGHLISNFTWDSDAVDYVGLFGYVAPVGEVYDVRMDGVNIYDDNSINVGGIAGGNEGNIHDCRVSGEIFGDTSVGGIVGLNYYDGTVSDCFASGEVGCEDYAVGGVVGTNAGIISGCAAEMDIVEGDWAGGFVGYNTLWSIINNCYAIGDVSGDENVGGFAGVNFAAEFEDYSDGEIYHCYAAGFVFGVENVGGFFGDYFNGGDEIESCFWDSDVNPTLDGVGSSKPDPAGVNAETTVSMYQKNTYESAGWDFTTPVWIIADGFEYPQLEAFHASATTDLMAIAMYWLDDDCGDCGGVDFDDSGTVDMADLAEWSRIYLLP